MRIPGFAAAPRREQAPAEAGSDDAAPARATVP
jgi:hypothetical protein